MAITIKIYKSELEAICRQVSQKQFLDIEVGGDLYGLWADDGTPVVYLATGPGPEAVFSEYRFHQDNEEIMRCEEMLFRRYGIQYLGDWHSHHVIGLEKPSSGDKRRIHSILRQPQRNKMIEFIVTHNYTDSEKKERINGYYYENENDPINMSIDELEVATSLVRTDLLSNRIKINLMNCLSKDQERIYRNYYLSQQELRESLNDDNRHYESFFVGLLDNVMKYIK